MAATTKESIQKYSLGVEEIALAFGLINAREVGANLIHAVYKDVNAENADVRLTVAGHSMLARGLCKISKGGTPVVDAGLEQALFPLVRFDRLIQASLVKDGKLDNASIHVQAGKTFTSHSNQAGIVHVLKHGNIELLNGFLADQFSPLEAKGKVKKTTAKITPGLIAEALKNGKDPAAVKALLTGKGWSKDLAEDLAKDISEQTFKATLVRINASQDVSMQALQKSTKPMLFVLKGAENAWLALFESSDDSCEAAVELVDRKQFEALLTTFLA